MSTLPPLPVGDVSVYFEGQRIGKAHSADQMRAHADAAQAAERERCAKLAAWLQWCLDNCDDCPEWNFGTTATGHIRSLLAGGDAPMPPTKPSR